MENNLRAQPTYRAGLVQSQAYRALFNFMTATLEPYGLSLSEWKTLGIISESIEVTPLVISRLIGIKPPIATRLLKQLEAKDLIKRWPDKKDARIKYAALTRSGRRLFNKIEKHLRPKMREFLGDISGEELEIYLKVLSKLAEKL